jgi:DNA-binding LacI/PurR family transcriptional regulator
MYAKSHLKPRHHQLAEQLRQRLLVENLRPGDKFMTVREIAEEYQVSLMTSHRSIQDLIKADLLKVEKFKGCFVGDAVRKLQRSGSKPMITVLTPESVFSHSIVPELFIRGIRQTLPHARVCLEYLPSHDMIPFLESTVSTGATATDTRAYVLRSVDASVKRFFAERKLPVIVMGSVEPGIDLPSVERDEKQVAYSVTQYLLSKGHKRIGYIEWDASLMGLEKRRDGFAMALQQAGLIKNQREANTFMISAAPHQNDTISALRQYMDRKTPPTAIIFGLEQQAVWGVRSLQQWGIKMPGDLAVVSLEGGALTSHLLPRITAVSQSHYEGGAWVGNLAAKLLKGEPIAEHCHQIPASIDEGETT